MTAYILSVVTNTHEYSFFRNALETLQTWQRRARARRELARLSERDLHDIGAVLVVDRRGSEQAVLEGLIAGQARRRPTMTPLQPQDPAPVRRRAASADWRGAHHPLRRAGRRRAACAATSKLCRCAPTTTASWVRPASCRAPSTSGCCTPAKAATSPWWPRSARAKRRRSLVKHVTRLIPRLNAVEFGISVADDWHGTGRRFGAVDEPRMPCRGPWRGADFR